MGHELFILLPYSASVLHDKCKSIVFSFWEAGENEKKRRVCGGPIKFQKPSPQRGECNVSMAGVCAASVYNFDAAWVCCHERNSALKKIKYELSLRMRTSLVGTQPSSVLFC